MSACKRTNRSDAQHHDDEELKEFADKHLPYELRMLRVQVECWANRGDRSDPSVDALLEASLVHIRLLNDFLCKKPERDDVGAYHFAISWQVDQHSVLDCEQRDKVNAQLFQLPIRRQISHQWGLPELMHQVCSVFCDFIAQADDKWKQALEPAHHQAQLGLDLVIAP